MLVGWVLCRMFVSEDVSFCNCSTMFRGKKWYWKRKRTYTRTLLLRRHGVKLNSGPHTPRGVMAYASREHFVSAEGEAGNVSAEADRRPHTKVQRPWATWATWATATWFLTKKKKKKNWSPGPSWDESFVGCFLLRLRPSVSFEGGQNGA